MNKHEDMRGLDTTLSEFRSDLNSASDLIIRLYEQLPEKRITPSITSADIASLFDEPLPMEPEPMDRILRQVENDIFANSTLYQHPRFFGYINSGGNQASILAELLAAAVNQICTLWHFSPAASEVERRVIHWLAEFIGYGAPTGGCLLSGGSAGNLIALSLARTQKADFDTASAGMREGPLLTVYMSQEGHASVDKAMSLLGMGRNNLRRIAVRDDFTIDLDSLKKQVDGDRRCGKLPVCVVGVAGSTNTGAVDPLRSLALFCQEEGLWFHVDAAYGGPAACTKSVGSLFQGLEQADSVVLNPHKWLYVPAEAACPR
jgi:aromatic-L-amino-acid/L-tryptophan decarboxylase